MENFSVLTHENKRFIIDRYYPHNTKYYRNYLKLIFKDIFIKLLFYKKNVVKPKKYFLSILSIFKNEAPFLKEFIEYYLLMGVDHFYLYNNNSEDNYMDILEPYISKGIVTFHDWPLIPGQDAMYDHFYIEHRHETNWVSFLDLDEFICPIKDLNIPEWLKKHDKYPEVMIYWKMFGTNGKMDHDYDRLLVEQYTNSWPKLDSIGKIIWNTDYDIVEFFTGLMHGFKVWYKGYRIPPINQFGYFVDYGIHRYSNEELDIQCNHYWSKSYENYKNKHKRGDAVFGKSWKTFDKFLLHENHNTSSDFSIFRFLTQLKLKIHGNYPSNIYE